MTKNTHWNPVTLQTQWGEVGTIYRPETITEDDSNMADGRTYVTKNINLMPDQAQALAKALAQFNNDRDFDDRWSEADVVREMLRQWVGQQGVSFPRYAFRRGKPPTKLED